MGSASYALGATLVPMITGVSGTEMIAATKGSSPEALTAFKALNLVINLLTFGGSAFLFAYASHPDRKMYLGFRKIKKPVLVVFALFFSIALLPLVLQLATWISDMNLSAAATEMQEANDEKMKGMLDVHTIPSFLFTLFVLALVPAVSEELFFRGVVMRFFHKQTRNIHFSIFTSAAVFSFFHGTPYSFVSILIMGLLLGYIYYYTGSIWVSMIVHFTHNAIQIIMSYLAVNGIIAEGMKDEDSFEWYILVIGVAIAAVFFYLLKKKATPLPDGWSNDFTEQELQEAREKNNNSQ